jgi:dsRNA-specific ribonuclease
MFLAKRVWENPKSLGSTQRLDEDIRDTPTVELPQELCHESPLADPLIVLHSVMLPQLLYQLEHYLTVISFMEHCSYNFPILEKCLSELTVSSVMEALTAKSCGIEAINYDRLEWLGDAVLKLLQTDALLKWQYTSYLHEGNNWCATCSSFELNADDC